MAGGLYENGKPTHLHFHEAQKAIYYYFFPMGYHKKIIIIIIIIIKAMPKFYTM